MENLTTQLAPRFVVQYVFVEDVPRGGGVHMGPPRTVAVTNTLSEAFEIVSALGDEKYAQVLEVYNPVRLNGVVTKVGPKVHKFPTPPQPARSRRR